jgi:hypothetical protein
MVAVLPQPFERGAANRGCSQTYVGRFKRGEVVLSEQRERDGRSKKIANGRQHVTLKGIMNVLVFLFGAGFVAVGALAYIPNSYVGSDGLVLTNDLHNYLHVATGALLILGVLTGRIVGALILTFLLYAVLAIAGFTSASDHVFGHVHINDVGRYLHVGAAISLYILLHYTIRARDTW